MMSNLSSTYFRNADLCAEIARTTKLGSIRDQQLGAEKAWRVLGDRAFSTEQKAKERAGDEAHQTASDDDQD